MDLLTVKQAGELWNITARMATIYCETGRIPGAFKKGNLWLIPGNAVKPVDRRRKPKIEIWDLYDEHRQLTGRDHIRGEEIPPGYFHLVVHVWIRNSDGKYLISQRSADRPMHPLKWECVGGSVLKGEDSLTGALRETKEEVGLTLDPKYGKIVRSTIGRVINWVKFSDIVDVWLFSYDGSVSLEMATTDEVAQSVWLDKKQIKELFNNGDFVDTLGYFFKEKELGGE